MIRYGRSLFVVVCLLSPSQSPVCAAEYFVCNQPGQASGANKGSAANPWKLGDLPDAKEVYEAGPALKALVAGDTLTFLPGTYNLATTSGSGMWNMAHIRPMADGTAVQPITIRAQPGETVILNRTSGNRPLLGDMHGPGATTRKYIRFEGFVLQGATNFGVSLWGDNNEVAYCKITSAPSTDADISSGIFMNGGDNVRIHHNEIFNWSNRTGILVYNSTDCVIEDNYVHDNRIGIFDKDSAKGNIYRRNYSTANSYTTFMGSNQTSTGRSDAQYYVYDNVLDGAINLLYVSRGIEFHDNLLRDIPDSNIGVVATGGSVYQTRLWNNVYIGKRANMVGYQMDHTAWSTIPPNNALDYCDYNVYDATPTYRFGRYNKTAGADTTFSLEQMRGFGFETNAKVVSGATEIYEDETSYKLKAPWLKAGRNQDPVGPDDVATILDVKRYGPAARPAPAAK